MKEERRREQNQRRLDECHPIFAAAMRRVIEELERQGLRPRVQDAWRSPAAQLAAFEAGDSELKFGFHNVTGADGRKESLAVDLLDDDAPLHPSRSYLLRLAAVARAEGLDTGIDWGLSAPARTRIARAIADRSFAMPLKVGWDPCHVEVSGIPLAQARRGERPTEASLRAAAAERAPASPPGPAPRALLVRQVGGPARAVAGDLVTYRATAFNLSDPTEAEKATIHWVARSDGATLAETAAGGDSFELALPSELAGRSIRVMAFVSSPSPRVSVVTRVQPRPPASPSPGGATDPTRASEAGGPRVVTIERTGTRYHARVDGGPAVFVGSDVSFDGSRGLMNTRDESGDPYDPAAYRDRFGFWADFIHPTARCESRGYFQRINTYDRARFTFGFFQHAAHTPRDNFVVLLRALLALPLGASYFPDLVVRDGAIHRQTDSGLEPLESDQSTAALMAYLNPSRATVDEVEAVHAAKMIHWCLTDPLHRAAQVEFTISQMKRRMATYSSRYRLDGVADAVCLAVADIRHQGRARSTTIIEALESSDSLESLLRIGEDHFPQRITTLRESIESARNEGILGTMVYDEGARDFVPV